MTWTSEQHRPRSCAGSWSTSLATPDEGPGPETTKRFLSWSYGDADVRAEMIAGTSRSEIDVLSGTAAAGRGEGNCSLGRARSSEVRYFLNNPGCRRDLALHLDRALEDAADVPLGLAHRRRHGHRVRHAPDARSAGRDRALRRRPERSSPSRSCKASSSD